MNLTAELQYLHDKLAKVDLVRLNLYFLPTLRAFIKSNGTHMGQLHGVRVELSNMQDEAVKNRFGKEVAAVCKDIDITWAAYDFFYATTIIHNAIGTKQEANVAKYQGVRLAKAKKVLDLL